MSVKTENRQVVLVARPASIPQRRHFAIRNGVIRNPGAGEVLIRNHFLSVEPAMRGWVADTDNYVDPVPIGSVMRALAAGEVIASEVEGFEPGDQVAGWFGWQEYATVPATSVVRKVIEHDLPLSLSLGVLGITGVTALLALTLIGQPNSGDSVLVSSAAGAVGSAVGQIAKLLGCRAVGIAGGADKVRTCLDEFGYDAAIDYRSYDFAKNLARACPQGVDVYFDNVAGVISDVVFPQLAQRARVVVCGTVSINDWSDWPTGPRVERHLLVKRARMEGFVVFDHAEKYSAAVQQLATWVRGGRIRYKEEFRYGIDAAPDSIASLYRSENGGKLLIQLF